MAVIPFCGSDVFFYLFVRFLLFAMMLTLLVTGCVSTSTFYVVSLSQGREALWQALDCYHSCVASCWGFLLLATKFILLVAGCVSPVPSFVFAAILTMISVTRVANLAIFSGVGAWDTCSVSSVDWHSFVRNPRHTPCLTDVQKSSLSELKPAINLAQFVERLASLGERSLREWGASVRSPIISFAPRF